MSIGPAIATARRRLKLSQSDLAHATGVSTKTVHNYEAENTQPTKAWLSLASSVLETDLMSVAGYESPPAADPILEGVRRVLTTAIQDIEELIRRHDRRDR